MSDETAFLTGLKANPADDLTRLVYADWLDDRDEPQKAQYLRAVADLARLCGGTAEYPDAAGRLYTACPATDPWWRREAGGRFDVVLDGYESGYKIQAIKIIREQTGFGLAESKALAESVPTALFSWLPFELALPRLLAFDWRPGGSLPIFVAIRPTPWPDAAGRGAVFDVFLDALNFDLPPDAQYRVDSAIRGVAALLGIGLNEARAAVAKLPLALATGLAPTAVAEFVQRVKRTCNIYSALPAGAIRVVPRLPNT